MVSETNDSRLMSVPPNLFSDLPQDAGAEHFTTLLESSGVKIERIVSRSHASPAGFWYDQDHEEWVLVLRGEAVLEFADGPEVTLKAGDHQHIPAHRRHRVDRTSAETIWLAVHFGN
jgi:cupin 2 domain-containing protein